MKNRPSGCKSASDSRLFARIESAGSFGGSPKSSSLVRRLASAQSTSLSRSHSCRLILSPSVSQPAAQERRLRGSGIFTDPISNICFYFGGPHLGALRIDDFKFQFYQQPQGWPGEKVTTDM